MGTAAEETAAWMQAHLHGQNVVTLQLRVNELTDEKKVLLGHIQRLTTHQSHSFDKTMRQGKLIGHFLSCCKAWIQRFQFADHPEAPHAVKEMRKVLEKAEREK